jgi:hypothetical protein
MPSPSQNAAGAACADSAGDRMKNMYQRTILLSISVVSVAFLPPM